MRSVWKFGSCAILGLLALGLAGAGPSLNNEFQGITKPSDESKLSLPFPGVVEKIDAKVGQVVKKGELLIKLDTRIDEKQLDAARLEGDSMSRVEYAKSDLKVKQLQLQKKKDGNDAFSPTEIEEAELAVKLAETQIKVEEVTHGQKKAEAERQAIKVEQMSLRAPYDAIVQKVDLSLGETADPAKPALTVVKNDPLWVELYIPVGQVQDLKAGQTMQVKHERDANWESAKVIFLAPKADAASGMQQVMLEMPNPNGRSSGQTVQVRKADGVAGTN